MPAEAPDPRTTDTRSVRRAPTTWWIQLGFGAGNVVVADTIEIAIEIEFTTTESDPR
jgi:hypothetical protein